MNAEKIKNDPDKSCWEDVTSQCITFPSEWRDRHPTHDAATQSAPIETSDEMQQTIRSAFITNGTCDSNIQCELDANSELFHRELIPDGQKLLHIYPSCGSEITQETLRSIVQALSTATPLLDSNLTTRAFKGYRARSTQQSECAVDPCHSLTPSFTLQQEHQYHILVMGWNCNFTMLAVSYGRNDVTTWCLERGHVCIYREFQTKPTAEAAPEWVEPLDLEQSTYVTSLSFHPTQPATMALGTFTGDLVILSLDRGEGAAQSLFSTKNMTTLPLRDAIVKIVWIPSQSGGSESMWLCTVCNDGQVFLWERSIKTNIIEVRHSMEFEPKIGMQIKVNTSAVGAVCVESIRNMNDLILIVGTDNGYTFQSHPNALSVQSLGIFNREKSEQPHSLSGATSQSHTGAVTDLSLAPQGGFLFATCGCDGRIRVCTTHDNICRVEMEPKAAAIEHYLTCIAWSPHRPSLVAVGTREGTLHVYDLSSSTQSPAVSVNCGHNTSLTTVHFHPTEKSLLITGDTRGKVTIWYLKGSFTEQTPLEKALKNERRSTHLRRLWLELLGVHL